MKRFAFIFGVFALVVLFCYLKPTSEILNCDNSYNCAITQNFAFGISNKKNIKIDYNANLEYEIRDIYKGRMYYTELHPIILNNNNKIKPFIYYYSSNYKEPEVLISKFNIIKQEFSSYLKNPDRTFSMSSAASGLEIAMPFIILIFLFIIGYLIEKFENLIYKK